MRPTILLITLALVAFAQASVLGLPRYGNSGLGGLTGYQPGFSQNLLNGISGGYPSIYPGRYPNSFPGGISNGYPGVYPSTYPSWPNSYPGGYPNSVPGVPSGYPSTYPSGPYPSPYLNPYPTTYPSSYPGSYTSPYYSRPSVYGPPPTPYIPGIGDLDLSSSGIADGSGATFGYPSYNPVLGGGFGGGFGGYDGGLGSFDSGLAFRRDEGAGNYKRSSGNTLSEQPSPLLRMKSESAEK